MSVAISYTLDPLRLSNPSADAPARLSVYKVASRRRTVRAAGDRCG